ncbi:MAG: efflux RND transporter permease subunit [Oscillatoriales cyanobacterium SM2_2_1]|nr:efflux RND transporter permease subunit [Oscillatoriales cyanobacterium SM2_2_1]
MSLSTLSIRRHIGTLMLMIAIMAVGVFTASRLSVDLLPSISYPRVAVQLEIPGASPEISVTEVTRPLEETLASVEGVNQIFSRTSEGRVRVDLFFNAGSDVDQALNDTVAIYNRGQGRLPDNVENVRIFKFDPSQLPIYELALTSPSLSLAELQLFGTDELARELTLVPGVSAVDISGGVSEEVQVDLRLERLQTTGLSIQSVLTALNERNQDTSGGRLRGGSIEPLTRVTGRFQSAAELEGLIMLTGDRQPVYLRDLATIKDGTAEQRVFATLNGTPAVRVSVAKQPESNTIAVIDAVKAKIEELRDRGLFPEGTVLTATLDESRLIRSSINNVVSSGLLGTVLAGVAVLFSLGSIRQTLIIALSIPLSSLVAVIMMGIFGFSLNLFSLGGLALGVGIVVDNSIVMLENIAVGLGRDRHLLPEEVIERSIASGQELESALVASTSTNLVAVLPFLLVGGFLSLLFNELILTISFAVGASLMVAVTVVPMLSSRLLALPISSGIDRWWIFREFDNRFVGLTGRYGAFLSRVLTYRWLVLLAVFLILGGGALAMVQSIPREIVPQVRTGDVNVNLQFPVGTTLARNQSITQRVDEILQAQPESQFVFTTVGGSLFGNFTNANPLRSSSTVILKSTDTLREFVQRVNREVSALNLAGVRVRVNPSQVRGIIVNNSPVPRTDIDVILEGRDPEVLSQASSQVLAALEQQVTGANFRPDTDARQPEVQIQPNWERLQRLGLSAQNVGQVVETAITGTVPTRLQRGDRLIDIRVRVASEDIRQPSQLNQLPVFTQGNQPIRLGDVAQIRSGRAPGEIQRINQRQVALLLGNLERGANLGSALEQVEAAIASVNLPEGVTVLPSSGKIANEQLQRSFVTLGLLASFLVFVVMAVQYNSLLDPLVIMITVPLALAGGIAGLAVTGTALSAIVVIGAVLLVGIVVNNAIILVELANEILARERCSRLQAMLKAAPQRLRPIFMTTVTTVLGTFPLALGLGEGGEFLQPLGVVVFSGLSLATLLTLFVIPCSYVIIHELNFNYQWKWMIRRLGIG